jgi:hypothetical protein
MVDFPVAHKKLNNQVVLHATGNSKINNQLVLHAIGSSTVIFSYVPLKAQHINNRLLIVELPVACKTT